MTPPTSPRVLTTRPPRTVVSAFGPVPLLAAGTWRPSLRAGQAR